MNRQFRLLPIILLVCGVVLCSRGQEPADAPPPSAKQLLADVLALMPQEPLFIAGQLQTKEPDKKTEQVLNVQVFLELGTKPAKATYTIYDELGAPLEQLKVSREAGKKPVYEYAAGNPLQPRATPDLSKPLHDSGISWSDLTLSFLWWRADSVVGDEEVKGFHCYIIEVQPPPDEARPNTVTRLWISEKHRMLLQAEERDSKTGALRRLSVKSFKQIEDEWMIKDLLLESLPSRQKTFLRVRELQNLKTE